MWTNSKRTFIQRLRAASFKENWFITSTKKEQQLEFFEISDNQDSNTKIKKIVHQSKHLTPDIRNPSILTLIEEFKKVIVEQFEREYRDIFSPKTIFAAIGQLGFWIRCKKWCKLKTNCPSQLKIYKMAPWWKAKANRAEEIWVGKSWQVETSSFFWYVWSIKSPLNGRTSTIFLATF